MKTLDLDKPEDAKTYLRGIRVMGKEVTALTLANDKELFIEDMTDDQLVHYAKEFYLDIYKGSASGEVVELETAGQNQ